MMSVEGPCHSHPQPDQRGRPNACSKGCDHDFEVAYGSCNQYPALPTSPTARQQGRIMPTSMSSQSLLASLPSFMSVFGDGSEKIAFNEANPTANHSPIKTHTKRLSSFSASFVRRDSTSTFESTESSPTTTISTMESSLTEASPQSPPESPDSSSPISSFKYLRTHSVPGPGVMGDVEHKEHFSNSFPILPGMDRVESPNKKMRNMKNLSVNTSAASRQNSQLPKLGLLNQSNASHAFSAPPTPAFIVPPKVPRKKPSTLGLTITTPEATTNGQTNPKANSIVTPNPSEHQIRTLRTLQTSTNGPLFSPTVAPEGGMRLPPFSNTIPPSRCSKVRPPLSVPPHTTVDNASSSPITRQVLDHVQEEADYEVPLSQEQKSPAYPQGPVCIYDPHVYLYLEPSHLEAREFDVVLNVAREVKNPFTNNGEQNGVFEKSGTVAESNLGEYEVRHAGRDGRSEPQMLSFERSPENGTEEPVDDTQRSTPSTPRATRPSPEYIHVPWDHNTNVVDDLLRLCELIDDRVCQGKQVLIHCQCGVSRSASLVVAFGLYKNPQLTVQEAYDAVKNRSRWIGPNMNLIYQLSEFKSRLPKYQQTTSTSAWQSWRNSVVTGRTEPTSLLDPSSQSRRTSSTPRNAPQKSLSAPSGFGRNAAIDAQKPTNRPASVALEYSSIGDITPGPSSAPADMHFIPGQASATSVDENENERPLTSGPPHPPSMGNTTLSPSSISRETIDQKDTPPLGGVSKYLEEVAKDLDMNEHMTSDLHVPTLDTQTNFAIPYKKISAEPNSTELDEPVSPRTVRPLDSNFSSTDPSLEINNVAAAKSNVLATKIIPSKQSPTLPAGFSSLFSRRQGPLGSRQLPLRQGSPRLIAVTLPQRVVDPDVPPTPSLLSPRAAEFTASPFHRTAAGDLAGSSVFEQGLMSPRAQDEDPRSPVQTGEAPITRSIFDMI